VLLHGSGVPVGREHRNFEPFITNRRLSLLVFRGHVERGIGSGAAVRI
jgi:hypothetical protein